MSRQNVIINSPCHPCQNMIINSRCYPFQNVIINSKQWTAGEKIEMVGRLDSSVLEIIIYDSLRHCNCVFESNDKVSNTNYVVSSPIIKKQCSSELWSSEMGRFLGRQWEFTKLNRGAQNKHIKCTVNCDGG